MSVNTSGKFKVIRGGPLSTGDLYGVNCNLELELFSGTCDFRFTENRLSLWQIGHMCYILEPYVMYYSFIFSSVSFMAIESFKYAIYFQRYTFLILPKQHFFFLLG
jgi:hypothetical protein